MTLVALEVQEGAGFSDRMLNPGHSQYSGLSKKVPPSPSYDRRIQRAVGVVDGSQGLDAMRMCQCTSLIYVM
jgi:hypothetical protein